MLALEHPVRVKFGMQNSDFGEGPVNLVPKYRPHLFGILLATARLKRLQGLNRMRRRNWQILCDELADIEGITPVATRPEAERGGFLRFKFLLAEGVDREKFFEAVKPKGVLIPSHRYGFLHDASIYQNNGPLSIDSLQITTRGRTLTDSSP